jgi:hypothetical protein
MSEKFTPVNQEGGGQLYLPAHIASEKVQSPHEKFAVDVNEMNAQNEVIGTHGLGSLRNEDAKSRLSEVEAEKLEKSIKDILNPEHIIDLKAAYDHRLEKVKDESRLSVDATRTSEKSQKSRSLAEELKNSMIDSYTRVGNEDREVPENVKDDISRLMNLSYEELENMIAENADTQTSNESAEEQNDQSDTRVRPSSARRDLHNQATGRGVERGAEVSTLEDQLQQAQDRMHNAVESGDFEEYFEAQDERDAIQNRLDTLDGTRSSEVALENENNDSEDAGGHQNPEETEVSGAITDDETDLDPEPLPDEANEETMAQRKTNIFTKAKDRLAGLAITAKTRATEGTDRVKEYFNDEEKGKRRKIVAGVIGAVAAGGAAYLAYKNLYNGDVPNISAEGDAGNSFADFTPEQMDAWEQYYEWSEGFKADNPTLTLADGVTSVDVGSSEYSERMHELWEQYHSGATTNNLSSAEGIAPGGGSYEQNLTPAQSVSAEPRMNG